MAQAQSIDLRVRLLAAIDSGLSCRAATARFGVAPLTAIRWEALRRDIVSFAPKSQGGDLHSRRVAAPMMLDGPLNGDWFEAYVTSVRIANLRSGDVVIMDVLSNHKCASVRERVEAAGVSLRLLPPCSPDFTPIEKAFSKLKAMLRKAEERTVGGLWDLIGKLADIFKLAECGNYFSSCGYDPA